jgi:hypothetical protein
MKKRPQIRLRTKTAPSIRKLQEQCGFISPTGDIKFDLGNRLDGRKASPKCHNNEIQSNVELTNNAEEVQENYHEECKGWISVSCFICQCNISDEARNFKAVDTSVKNTSTNLNGSIRGSRSKRNNRSKSTCKQGIRNRRNCIEENLALMTPIQQNRGKGSSIADTSNNQKSTGKLQCYTLGRTGVSSVKRTLTNKTPKGNKDGKEKTNLFVTPQVSILNDQTPTQEDATSNTTNRYINESRDLHSDFEEISSPMTKRLSNASSVKSSRTPQHKVDLSSLLWNFYLI